MAASRLSLRYIRRFTTTTGDSATTVVESTKISTSKAKRILRKQHDPHSMSWSDGWHSTSTRMDL
ncbi:hypothetical protein F2Q70_00012984 [Brassica cretica]|uniref:Uncharacterized protein n=1 Tax=Brassica cretica TaxID=69181 RepID=A0A8S9LUQ6_BRACR|nr:hypothetical protein F2Q70_00012984 [Brassica cretica]